MLAWVGFTLTFALARLVTGVIKIGDQDTDEVYRRLREFVLPYLDIRDRTPGYAVSIVKAGLEAIGRPAGPVRPPLTDLRPDERAELATLVERTRLVETAR